MLHIRKSLLWRDTLTSELGQPAARAVTRAVAVAVIANPFAGRYVEDLTELFQAGRALGEQLMPDLVRLLPHSAISYGKGAIVGVNGEFEHGAACIHPMLGKPMRAAVGGGKAVIPSNVKVAAAGISASFGTAPAFGSKSDTSNPGGWPNPAPASVCTSACCT